MSPRVRDHDWLEAAVRSDVVSEAESVIKLALAIWSYRLAEDGRLDLAERVRLTRSDYIVGTGILQHFQEGLEPTLRDLVTAMIIVSANSAVDLLLARTGGVADLNAWLAASGYPQARMARSGLDATWPRLRRDRSARSARWRTSVACRSPSDK